jgi:hypothetical protein
MSSKKITIKLGVKTPKRSEIEGNHNKPAATAESDEIPTDNWTRVGAPASVQANTGPRTRSKTEQQQQQQQQQKESGEKQAGTDVSSFQTLQQHVCPVIDRWAKSPQARSHKFHQIWLIGWKDSISTTSQFALVKKKLGIKSLEEYYKLLIQCPDILAEFSITYNPITKKIHYKKYGSTPKVIAKVDHPSTTSPDYEDMPYLAQDTQSQESSSNTERLTGSTYAAEQRANELATEAYSDMLTALEKCETPMPLNKDGTLLYQAGSDYNTFAFLQSEVIPILQEWAHQDNSKVHPFYTVWKAWEPQITETTPLSTLLQGGQVQDLHAYMDLIKSCPAVRKKIFLTWNPECNAITWGRLNRDAVPACTQILATSTKQPMAAVRTVTNTTDDEVTTTEEEAMPLKADYRLLEPIQEPNLEITEETKAQMANNTTKDTLNAFINQMNITMENIGVNLKDAQNRLNDQIEDIHAKLNFFEAHLANFDERFEQAINQAHREVADMDSKVTFFHKKWRNALTWQVHG